MPCRDYLFGDSGRPCNHCKYFSQPTEDMQQQITGDGLFSFGKAARRQRFHCLASPPLQLADPLHNDL